MKYCISWNTVLDSMYSCDYPNEGNAVHLYCSCSRPTLSGSPLRVHKHMHLSRTSALTRKDFSNSLDAPNHVLLQLPYARQSMKDSAPRHLHSCLQITRWLCRGGRASGEALPLPELVLNASTALQALVTLKFTKGKTIYILQFNCKCTPGNAASCYTPSNLTGIYEKY